MRRSSTSILLQTFAAVHILLVRFTSSALAAADSGLSGSRCGQDQEGKHCPGDLCCNAASGWCGDGLDWCDLSKCASEYGRCGSQYVAPNASSSGKCGLGYGKCDGNLCCSSSSYCGPDEEYCSLSLGCNPDYGTCWSPSGGLSTGAIVGIVLSAAAVVAAAGAALCFYTVRKTAKRFSHRELYAATDGFSEANKLGAGTYGEVYKGTLKGGKVIAVKKLKKMSFDSKTEVKAFQAEIQTRTERLNHKNLMEVMGYCVKNGDRFLVYEYMNDGSLEDWLFHSSEAEQGSGAAQVHFLQWPQRFDIVKGIADGLIYLHHSLGGDIKSIVHDDIKPANILLARGLVPKLADFGMAKLIRISDERELTGATSSTEEGEFHVFRPRGTPGYRAPEAELDKVSINHKADVYSFGIVLLEVVSGRRVYNSLEDNSRYYLPVLAVNCFLNEPEDLSIVLDPKLELFPAQKVEVRRVLRAALWCLHTNPKDRPNMNVVLDLMKGNIMDESIYQDLPPNLLGMRDRFEDQERDLFRDPQVPQFRFTRSSNMSGYQSNSQLQPSNFSNSGDEPQINGDHNEAQVSHSQPLSDLSSEYAALGNQKKGANHPD